MQDVADMTFATYRPQNERQRIALATIAERDRSYYLYGDYGVGKTHLMVAMALRSMQKGRAAVLINVPKLLQAMRKSGRDNQADIEEMAANIPVLCLDDIGKQKDSDWTEERLFMLIDARWKLQRRDRGFTCFTSQYPIDDLVNRHDGAIISRIRGMCWPIRIDGEDYRQREVR